MSERYFVIQGGEDASIEEMGKSELIKRLEPQSEGDGPYYHQKPLAVMPLRWLSSVSNDRGIDLSAKDCLIIIKGTIVVPKPIKVVEKVEID